MGFNIRFCLQVEEIHELAISRPEVIEVQNPTFKHLNPTFKNLDLKHLRMVISNMAH
jgi:hypothetical protein